MVSNERGCEIQLMYPTPIMSILFCEYINTLLELVNQKKTMLIRREGVCVITTVLMVRICRKNIIRGVGVNGSNKELVIPHGSIILINQVREG
jgi:hypothetical protein